MFNRSTARVSSTGRSIKTPRKILSNSDEETRPPKTSKRTVTVKQKSNRSDSSLSQQNTASENSAITDNKLNSPLYHISQIEDHQEHTSSTHLVDQKSSLTSLILVPDVTVNETLDPNVLATSLTTSQELYHYTNQDPLNAMSNRHDIFYSEQKHEVNKDNDLKFKNEILQRLDNIEKQNKRILEILNDMRGDSEKFVEETLYQPLTGFPLKTMEEFESLVTDKNKENRQKVHDHLVRLGGSRLKEFLSGGLKEIMDDQLVAKFTWLKTKDTEKFGDTKVSNIFYRAAIKCPLFDGPTNKEIYKQTMLEVLKSTKQRFRNKIKKELNQRADVNKKKENIVVEIKQENLSTLNEYIDDDDEEFNSDAYNDVVDEEFD
ncbi:uncharacterized protein LOC127278143 [Leptopilina boulardi]|uniref:uncharacterized protein LOC127278143 n=1 Tax=Leptopilina boulardi TaxID=63433 RepID=UPI0021F50BB5|nr:uncharacterized protein LOC127278143 [Leptopilina boulardi]